MAVPKRKTTPSRRGMRRSHDSISYSPAIVESSDTGEQKLRHHIDADGFYKGRKVLRKKPNPNAQPQATEEAAA